MIGKVPMPSQMEVLHNQPLDSRDKVFSSQAEIDQMIENGMCYSGQLIKLKIANEKNMKLFILQPNMTLLKIGTSDDIGGAVDMQQIVDSITWKILD